jgi:hypothetical protein
MQAPSLIQYSAAPPPTEICAACGRSIGELEQPFVWEQNIVCFGCHRDLSQTPVQPGSELHPGQTDRTFFTDRRVTITRSLVVVDASSYAIADVRFVRLAKSVPRRAYAAAAALVGVATSVFGFNRHLDRWDVSLLAIGSLLFVIGLTTALARRPRYSVLITVDCVEIRVLTTTKAKYATAIVDAVGEAIVERGQYVAEPAPTLLCLPPEMRAGIHV